ncbi:MAG: hypothetical protein GF346_09975 [Candidatus Eisenbacteria bacterium]|nr:hypothetical protein [Candidatus Latescibacterota bacterium]MBD3302762.1 hypothetical protein [Candidatus Eisenbacteria bacterium]
MTRRGIRTIALAAALLAFGGCGQEFSLPPQPEPGRIPTPGTYNLDRIWQVPSPTDVIVQGSYLFVVEQRERVSVYLSHHVTPRPPGFIEPYEGLIRPVQVCLAKRDSTFLFVADEGDRMIKRYYFRGGPPLHAFTDTAWVEISGIAADHELNVYVADAARDTVYKYDDRGEPVRLVSDYGTGFGFVIDPHGMRYNDDRLWVADTGKDYVQALLPDSTNTADDRAGPIGGPEMILGPYDVDTDLAGETVFVADTGNDQVLRFEATGALRDTVYSHAKWETRAVDPPLTSIRHVAADDSLVFLPDSANDRIVILRLATQ